MIEREQAEHNSQNIYYRSTIGAVEAGSILQLGLRLKTREDIRQVLLRLWQEGKGEKLYPLTTDADMEAEEKFLTIRLRKSSCRGYLRVSLMYIMAFHHSFQRSTP